MDRPTLLGLMLEELGAGGGRIRVKDVIPGYLAASTGKIQKNDNLIRIDGKSCAEMTVDEATRLIAGASDQSLSVNSSSTHKSNKPCGIGLTVLDTPPHLVTDISKDGPLAQTYAIQVCIAIICMYI
jgi:C-terminal processing protease CtpA/Prc